MNSLQQMAAAHGPPPPNQWGPQGPPPPGSGPMMPPHPGPNMSDPMQPQMVSLNIQYCAGENFISFKTIRENVKMLSSHFV